jgi:uracil-DNA glycosylase family 4
MTTMTTMTPDHARAAREILAFYAEAGVDAAIGEMPVDRFAEPAAPVAAPAADRIPGSSPPKKPLLRTSASLGPKGGAAVAPPTSAPPSPDAAVMAAREAARAATSLDQLRAMLEGFEGCALRNTATRLVFADGNPQARLMFVGEAPGYEEDKQGLPFVGRSGQLLDKMLAAIGLDRTKVYIANIVPWRPPGNRTPTPQESQICLPFIRRQIELVDPDVLVCLGGPSMQTLLDIKDGIMKTRGRWMPYNVGARQIRAMATLHPAYLLRQPLAKRLAWRDFMAVSKALAG